MTSLASLEPRMIPKISELEVTLPAAPSSAPNYILTLFSASLAPSTDSSDVALA